MVNHFGDWKVLLLIESNLFKINKKLSELRLKPTDKS